MLPIRIVAESLGGTVTWNGELQRVTIQKGADVILITIGAIRRMSMGTAVKLDAAGIRGKRQNLSAPAVHFRNPWRTGGVNEAEKISNH